MPTEFSEWFASDLIISGVLRCQQPGWHGLFARSPWLLDPGHNARDFLYKVIVANWVGTARQELPFTLRLSEYQQHCNPSKRVHGLVGGGRLNKSQVVATPVATNFGLTDVRLPRIRHHSVKAIDILKTLDRPRAS